MMFSGPALTLEYVNNKFYPYRCCQKLVAIIFSVILGLVINPFVWVGLIIYFLPKGIDFCVSYFRRRRAANETSNELIKEKFIREAEHVYDENEILQ